jgi:hypothetical protein
MGLKRTLRREQLRDVRRDHAAAYLRGEYPAWRMNLQEWLWVRRLRRLQDVP